MIILNAAKCDTSSSKWSGMNSIFHVSIFRDNMSIKRHNSIIFHNFRRCFYLWSCSCSKSSQFMCKSFLSGLLH